MGNAPLREHYDAVPEISMSRVAFDAMPFVTLGEPPQIGQRLPEGGRAFRTVCVWGPLIGLAHEDPQLFGMLFRGGDPNAALALPCAWHRPVLMEVPRG